MYYLYVINLQGMEGDEMHFHERCVSLYKWGGFGVMMGETI